MAADMVVRMALRQRQNRGVWIAVAILVLIGTAVWSHYKAKPDPTQWDGKSTRVTRVIDGDTVVCDGGGLTNEHVRLLGVDAPEIKHPGLDTDAHFGREAKAYLASKIEGQPVTLKFDGTNNRDRYQRLLAYVYLGDSDCVNVDLVRDGMAYAYRPYKNALAPTLEQNEQQARARGIGLWKGLQDDEQPKWRQTWLKTHRLVADE